MMSKKKPRISLTTGILIGLFLGIACGIFFGEACAFLQIFGDAFIGMLQMSILPYITVSLILGIGSMSYEQAKKLAVKGGLLLLLFWAISFYMVLLMPLTFPVRETAAFFSTSMVETPQKVDFIRLFIPANPFYALANNVIPAVVLFCILGGVALIGIKEKSSLLRGLSVAAEMLTKVTGFVVKLTPLGVFAISAAAAGTMSIEEFGRLQVYLVSFSVASLFFTFWILPKLVTAITPFSYRDVVGFSKDALITAFITGNLFIVLTVLIDNCKGLYKKYGLEREKTDGYVDVIVPVYFNFPTMGKLLMLLFILFAAWYTGKAVSFAQYPVFIFSGLLSFFGGVDIAMPFMLDLMKIPTDMYQLYMVTGIVNGRFATLLAAMDTVAFTLLATCLLTGTLRISKKKVAVYIVLTLLFTAAIIVGSHVYFSYTVKSAYTKDKELKKMHLMSRELPATVHTEPLPAPPRHDPRKSRLDEIRERGFIRVGYFADLLPYAFTNSNGELVGFDIELAHALARDLGVSLELVPVERDKMGERLEKGYCDVVMSSVAVTTDRLEDVAFSAPYTQGTLAFIVEDRMRDEFEGLEKIRKLRPLKLGMPDAPYYAVKIRKKLPDSNIVIMESLDEYLERKNEGFDAFVYTAEAGAAWTLVHPEYTVVVPRPDILTIPMGIPVARGDRDLVDFLNSWIELKKSDRTIGKLYDYWIQGKGAEEKKPRWCVIRDVLGWVE